MFPLLLPGNIIYVYYSYCFCNWNTQNTFVRQLFLGVRNINYSSGPTWHLALCCASGDHWGEGGIVLVGITDGIRNKTGKNYTNFLFVYHLQCN